MALVGVYMLQQPQFRVVALPGEGGRKCGVEGGARVRCCCNRPATLQACVRQAPVHSPRERSNKRDDSLQSPA
jgi:hypothetical protein